MKERDSDGLRQALAQFATGVTVVTTAGPAGEPIGVTANSFNSVSLEPPLVLWSLSATAYSRQAFERAGYFCVHVLSAEQEDLSQKFALRGARKFDGIRWVPGVGSIPMLEDCVARFECRSTQQHPVGDHIVFVGEVLRFDKSDRRPLVFHSGRYALAERRRMESVARQLGEAASHAGERRKRPTLP